MKQQTSVEWLIEMISPYICDEKANQYIEQAKQVEREQIIDSYEQGVEDEIEGNRNGQFTNAEKYYNEKYGKAE